MTAKSFFRGVVRVAVTMAVAISCLGELQARQYPVDTGFLRQPLRFTPFLKSVTRHNLGYAAQRYNISIAQASIESARIFQDPTIDIGAFDNGQRRMQMGYGFSTGIGYTLELGGKRRARIDLARSGLQLTEYQVQDFFRNLRADAAKAYLGAARQKKLLEILARAYQKMDSVAYADSIRHRLGAVSEADARQSKLEANTILNAVYQAEADWKTSLAALLLQAGAAQIDTLPDVDVDMARFERSYDLGTLIVTAQNNRADLLAALQGRTVAGKQLRLARANRSPDLNLSAGCTYASYVTNIVAPTPSFTQTSVGLSLPLKLSNKYAGELRSARYVQEQNETLYALAEATVRNEIVAAHFNYEAAGKQIARYRENMLGEAERILAGKIYSYRRGESSLIDLLIAQRAYNDVQQGYNEALYSYAVALVELERASGIWDLDF